MGMGITLNLTFSFRLLLNQRIFQYFKQFNISIIITMSSQNDPLAAAKQGYSKGDSATDSGIDDRATKKFPGASVTIGSAASGAGDNREIPVEEGGSIGKHGQPTKARDFEGEGGP